MALKKNLTDSQKAFATLCVQRFGPLLSRKQIYEVMKENPAVGMQWWIFKDQFDQFRVQRGVYNVQDILNAVVEVAGDPEDKLDYSADIVVSG